ncbi:nucleoside-diphosphate-sugar epimerase [Natronospira proteinivora]|uniref:Nucleoside-diphosphate-sugar epimerase n=1 Tax=Natronospira proteinivora TaxID=1807133 RepID=A0ABT1GD92_9GAMM|nr:NAD-dependent epimerase/dehydratase family protein [Natronospira proteinivora]MCP1727912.1 nucleoside-diphosphate-sugar epimerase [Natronospira proteinivora]
MPETILITGATGFVGRHLIPPLQQAGYSLRLAVRQPGAETAEQSVVVGEIGPDTEWGRALDGIDTVIHLAGRAHHPDGPGEAEAHEAINHQATRRLAEACEGRVQRLIHMSSLSVHGLNASDEPITEHTPIRPTTPYGTAKARAEADLAERREQGRLDSLSLRPPMVYGPGAPGNLARLKAAVERGWPLPLAWVRNQRSLIGVEHLAHILLAALALSPEAFRQLPPALAVSDDHPISTPDMARALGEGLGKPARLWPCPVSLLRLGARITARQAMMDSLTGSLIVDNQVSREALAQSPRALPASPETYQCLVQAMQEK